MTKKLRSAAGLAFLLAAMLSTSASVAAQTPKHSDTFIPGQPDESRLIQEVRHQLVMLPYYTIFDDLGFRVQGSTVILEGAVTRPVLKSDAENVVKRIEGVTNVVNNIEVLPVSEMDWQIRRAVARAIYGNPQIGDRYGFQALPSIHIIVKNGNVRLEGIVNSTFDKNLINVRANSVPGVFKVENDLQVEPGK
jgi:hyperosmotically inducible protein